jgi:hypothetical protein
MFPHYGNKKREEKEDAKDYGVGARLLVGDTATD